MYPFIGVDMIRTDVKSVPFIDGFRMMKPPSYLPKLVCVLLEVAYIGCDLLRNAHL